MPPNLVKSFSKKSGKSVDTIEKYWDDAQIVVSKQYPDVEKDSDRYFALVTSIVKKMAGIEDKKVETRDNTKLTHQEQIREALDRSIQNPFTEKSTIIFVDEASFIKAVESLTEYEVEQVKRSDETSYYILLDNSTGNKSKSIDSVQYIYGEYPKQKPIYMTEKVKKGLYQLHFNSKVVIK